MLTGVAAFKLKVDAYLYYGLNEWHTYFGPSYLPHGSGLWVGRELQNNTLNLLDFRNANESDDAEGSLLVPGPPTSRYRGMLSTLQFDNLRDGLEDHSMYTLLDSLLAKARAQGVNLSLEEQMAVIVPRLVLDGVGLLSHENGAAGDLGNAANNRAATDDPWVMRQNWRAVADAIESVQAKLKTDDSSERYGMFMAGMYLLRQIFLLALPLFRSTDIFDGAGTINTRPSGRGSPRPRRRYRYGSAHAVTTTAATTFCSTAARHCVSSTRKRLPRSTRPSEQ